MTGRQASWDDNSSSDRHPGFGDLLPRRRHRTGGVAAGRGGPRSRWPYEDGVYATGRGYDGGQGYAGGDDVRPYARRPHRLRRRLALLSLSAIVGVAAAALSPRGMDLVGQILGGLKLPELPF